MARKFLQMGYTRAMRYANHKGGRKYDSNHEVLPKTINEEKVECAQVRTHVELTSIFNPLSNPASTPRRVASIGCRPKLPTDHWL